MAKEGDSERHIRDDGRRLGAELVDYADVNLRQKERIVDEQEAKEPAPAMEAPRSEQPANAATRTPVMATVLIRPK
jgi:hypothetical protein